MTDKRSPDEQLAYDRLVGPDLAARQFFMSSLAGQLVLRCIRNIATFAPDGLGVAVILYDRDVAGMSSASLATKQDYEALRSAIALVTAMVDAGPPETAQTVVVEY